MFSFIVFMSVIASAFCASCNNPEVAAVSYTTQDATVLTHIAFIGEFTLKCSNTENTPNLYADIKGNVVPVARIGDRQYQVSWTEDIKVAHGGDRSVRLYDEDGYTLYRKALRAGDNVANVPSLVTIVITHPGAFQGPWLKSEFMAAALSLIVAYIAFVSKSKLLS